MGTAEEDAAYALLRDDNLLEHPRVADEDEVDVRGLQQVADLFEEDRKTGRIPSCEQFQVC